MKVSQFSTAAAAVLPCLTPALALPYRRADEFPVFNMVQTAMSEILKNQQIQEAHFIPGGLSVNWIDGGSDDNSSKLSTGEINQVIYTNVDEVQLPTGSNTTMFANAYKVFVQDLATALKLNDTSDDPEMEEKLNKQDELCGKKSDLYNEFYKKQIETAEARGKEAPTDDEIRTNIGRESRYQDAYAKCQAAGLDVDEHTKDKYGPNYAQFMQALQSIKPLTSAMPQLVEGITMPGAGFASTDTGETDLDQGDTSGGLNGHILPSYKIPDLADIVKKNKENPDSTDTVFSWDSSSASIATSLDTNEGSASAGVSFGRLGAHASASHSDTTETRNMKATSMKVTIGSFDIVEVMPGGWFGSWNIAQLAAEPTDNVTESTKAVFEKHFGTKEEPKAASRYNKKAIVASKIHWEMTFATEDEYKKFSETQFEAGANYLFFDASASGKKISEVAKTDAAAKSMSYTSNSTPTILGFVPDSYFGEQESKSDDKKEE